MTGHRWILQVYTSSIRRVLSYRLDFFTSFVGQLVAIAGVSYYLWTSIFAAQGAQSLGGYTLPALLFYYCLVPVTDRIVHTSDRGGVSVEIYDGSLTRYLLYPVSYFVYKYVARLGVITIAAAQFLIVVGAFHFLVGPIPDATITLSSLAAGLCFSIVAGVVYFTFQLCIEMTAFWADNIWSLLVMLRFFTNFLGGALIPLAFFPQWLARLTSYTPFPAFASVPIRLTLGRASMGEALSSLAVLAAWEIALVALAALVWSRGRRVYTGVGI